MSRHLVLAVLCVLLGFAPHAARAAEAVSRVGLHETFGRLVVEWPELVEIQTERKGAALELRASRPFPTRLGEAVGRLGRYVEVVTLDAGDSTLIVRPRAGIDLSYELLDGRLLVLDFRAAPAELRLRVGQHAGFVRLVIEPVAADAAVVDRSQGELEVELPGALSAWALNRLREVPGITDVALDGQSLKLALARTATARTQRVEPDKLVIDLVPPAEAALAAAPAGPEVAVPRAKPTRLAAMDETAAPVAEPPEVQPKVAAEAPPEPAAAATAEVAPAELPVVISATKLGGASAEIAFRWAAPVPAAVFVRGQTLWAVFGSAASAIEIDAEAFRAAIGQHVTGLRRERHPTATVLRLALAGERAALVHRAGASWIVTLRPADGEVGTAEASGLEPRDRGLLLPGIKALASLVDPVVGDRLGIGLALSPTGPRLVDSRFVGLRLMPSAQGAVWRELAAAVTPDDLSGDGLILTAAHGVLPTPAAETVAALPSAEPTFARPAVEIPDPAPTERAVEVPVAVDEHDPPRPTASRERSPLGLAPFATGDFRARRAALQAGMATAAGPMREAARLDLARLLVVHGLGAEALELLDAARVEADEAAGAGTAQAALTGAALLLMDRAAEAAKRLGDPRLAADDEVALWHGAAAASLGEWDQGLLDWERGAAHLATYPLDLQATLAVPGVRLLLETGRADAAFELIDRLTALDLRSDRLRSLRRLEALALERDGAADEALAAWRALAETGPLEERAVARAAATDLALAAGQISMEEAIATLEADRRDWRGQKDELRLWRRLAILQHEAGRIDEALETLRTAMHRTPPPAEAQAITGEMSAIFAEALAELGAGRRSPTSALLLYRRYQELMPGGPEGDDLALSLSAALLATGLANAGAEILDDRLELAVPRDARRARLGLGLARLHAASGAFDRTLATLVDSTPLDAVDADLMAERQRLVAEALAATSGSAALAGGSAPSRLRARAAFDAGDWPAVRLAAASLEAALPEMGPITPEAGEIVLMLATAARQMGDAQEVRRLARLHGGRLSSERDAAVLRLLAGLPSFAGSTDQVLADATQHLHEARDVLAALGAP